MQQSGLVVKTAANTGLTVAIVNSAVQTWRQRRTFEICIKCVTFSNGHLNVKPVFKIKFNLDKIKS